MGRLRSGIFFRRRNESPPQAPNQNPGLELIGLGLRGLGLLGLGLLGLGLLLGITMPKLPGLGLQLGLLGLQPGELEVLGLLGLGLLGLGLTRARTPTRTTRIRTLRNY